MDSSERISIKPDYHYASAKLNMHILKQKKFNRSKASNDAGYQNVMISCVDPIQFLLF